MTRSTPDVVESRLRRLDAAACGALVADIWAARGYETVREGDVVVASRDGTSVTLYPVGSTLFRSISAPDRPIDAVVAPGGGRAAAALAARRDAALLDASDLRELLWYAVDRSAAADLCERHLGAPPTDLRPPLRTRVRDRVSGVRVPASAVSVATVVAVLAGVAIAAGVGLTGVPGTPLGSGQGSGPDAAAPATPTETPRATPAVTRIRVTGDGSDAGAVATPTPPTTVRAPASVPGVTRDGIRNLSALAVAHRRVVGTQSYALWVDTYGPQGGRPGAERIKHDIDIAVADRRYRLVATRHGEASSRIVREVYHDGTDWFVADGIGNSRTYHRVPPDERADADDHGIEVGPDPFDLRRILVTRYLATPETAFTGQVTEDGRSFHRVVGRGSPPAFEDARNYSAVALIDRRGLVRDLTVEYTVVTDSGTYDRRFEAAYGHFGRTDVDPPDWYAREFHGNGTRSSDPDA